MGVREGEEGNEKMHIEAEGGRCLPNTDDWFYCEIRHKRIRRIL